MYILDLGTLFIVSPTDIIILLWGFIHLIVVIYYVTIIIIGIIIYYTKVSKKKTVFYVDF